VLHPALPSCPGHALWQRDFTGSASVFSVLFKDTYSARQVEAFVDGLHLFKIGMSWGGVTSLALAYPELIRPGTDHAGRLVRINVGLEDVGDLKADLAQSLQALQQPHAEGQPHG
jgi:cystathionine beta-lyase